MKLVSPFSLMPLKTPRTTAAMDTGGRTTHSPDRSEEGCGGNWWLLSAFAIPSVRLGSARLVSSRAAFLLVYMGWAPKKSGL